MKSPIRVAKRFSGRRWLLGCLLTILLPATATGQAAVAIRDFEPVGYLVNLDGQRVGAEVFQSRSAGAFLILTSELPAPVLVRLRDAQVVSVNLMKVNRGPEGSVELLPNATLSSQGTFRVTADREGIEFSVDGRAAELREQPPLLGEADIRQLEEHSPEYRRAADAYQPSGPILGRLREQGREVRVTVYFGSWCGFCKQMLPRIIKVAEQLEGSRVSFEFYGLPRGVSTDPRARRDGITGVPIGVVYVAGTEVGRISGNSWKVPELTLNNLLAN